MEVIKGLKKYIKNRFNIERKIPVDYTNVPYSSSFHDNSTLNRPLTVHKYPYPYFVEDSFVPWPLYQNLLRYWPEESCFDHDRSDGCRLIGLCNENAFQNFSAEQTLFWKSFSQQAVVDMIKRSMYAYGAKAVHKYKDDLNEILICQINLTEAFKPIRYLNIHTHHINGPTFIGTCIYFVDDHGCSERGTSIFGIKNDLDLSMEEYVDLCAELEYEHRTELELKRKIDFAPNRLLSIADSPITFHGVEDVRKLGMSGPRKMITIQWGVPMQWFDKAHGMSLEENWELRKQLPLQGKAREILQNDLENFLQEPYFSHAQLYQAFSRIRVKAWGSLSFIDEPLMMDSLQQFNAAQTKFSTAVME